MRGRGDDEVLLAEAVHRLVHELAGGDVALSVEEVPPDAEMAAVVDAAQTPPLLTARRVVVVREVGRFRAEDLGPLLAYLDDPLPSTALVLVGGGGQLSPKLVNAVKRSGALIDAGAPEGRSRSAWVTAAVKESQVRIDPRALDLVANHLGEDVSRLPALLRLLEGVFGNQGRLGPDDVAPFLGAAGGVAPWALTDAVDAGDSAGALAQLRRLLEGGGRHPLVVLATLHTHYARMLALEGADCPDEASAAARLGMTGSTFPARKALNQCRRLGRQGVARAVTLIAEADLALKGAVEWPGELVLEILVARLSRLVPAGPRRRGSR
ncbi:MAG: DNA polymerase III subunit delta [Acidimicrobiales bacterium]